MKFEKIIAAFLATLMTALTFSSAALAATMLSSYPSFLGSAGALDFYVVFGSGAKAEDVAGAVDIMARLAELSYTTKSATGSASAVTGTEKTNVPIAGSDSTLKRLSDTFGATMRNFHYSGLKTSTIAYKGNTYDYHEAVALGDVYTSHDFSTTGINGTQTLVVKTNTYKYQYVFDKALNLTDLATSAKNTGTIAAPEYSNPVKISLLGKDFLITGVGSSSVKMLVGSSGTATATTSVDYTSGNTTYKFYATQGATSGGASSSGWVTVVVKDQNGNIVESFNVDNGNTKDTTKTSPILTVKLNSIRALQDGTVGGADLVIGPQSTGTEKTYGTSCDVSGTGTSDLKFPGETEWCIQVGSTSFGTSGYIAVSDAIEVVYKPTTTKYIKSTDASPKLSLPNSWGDIGFSSPAWYPNTFQTLTFTPVSGRSGYHWTSVGTTNSTVAASNLNGIEIATDVAGSIVDPNTGTGYSKAYVLFNYSTGTTASLFNYPVMIGFYDSVNNRIGVNVSGGDAACPSTMWNCTYYEQLNSTAGATDVAPALLSKWFGFNFTISYSNGAAAADKQYLWVNVSVASPAAQTGGTAVSFIKAMTLGTMADVDGVTIAYYNKTSSWSTSAVPEFRLYSSDSAEGKDLYVESTDTAGTQTANNEAGTSAQDVVTDTGVIVKSPSSNAASNVVQIQVPAQVLYARMYFGKLGASSTSTTYNAYSAITNAVAKLDSEVTSTEQAKNLVSVGGPCANSVSAKALGVAQTFPECVAGIATGSALIKVVDDVYTTGKVVVVVAGYGASDTRTAATVLQQYDTWLKDKAKSSVTVTGLTSAGIV